MSLTALNQILYIKKDSIIDSNQEADGESPELFVNLNEYNKLPTETINAYLGTKSDSIDATYISERDHDITESPRIQSSLPKDAPKPLYQHPVRANDSYKSLQKWEGYVVENKKDMFIARLIDLTSEGEEEIAEIPIAEISESDLDLLSVGAVFYWNIAYKDSVSGQRERVSTIRFRRLPMWTKKELEDAKEKGRTLFNKLKWD